MADAEDAEDTVMEKKEEKKDTEDTVMEDAVDAEDAAPVEARADSLFHRNNSNGSEAANAFNAGRRATSNGIAHKQRGGRVASTSS